MTGELVPELHDIGKLTTLWTSGHPHNFEDFRFTELGIKPDSATWRGILEHHCANEYKNFPASQSTFLCSIADLLASSVSRLGSPSRGETGSDIVQKVWGEARKGNFPYIPPEDAARFVALDPSAEEYFQRFGTLLEQRSEETRRPVTSLRTHSELTGKFYRLLMKDSPITDDEIRGKTSAEVRQIIDKKMQSYSLTIACLKPHFAGKPFRTKDLGVFHAIEQTLAELSRQFHDNIIFQTPEQILLACHKDELRPVVSVFTNHKLWVEGWLADRPLRELEMLTLFDKRGPGTKAFTEYSPLPSQIPIPLCEICQMAEGSRPWSEDGNSEWLCETCFQTRREAPSMTKLAGWERESVLWVQVRLNLDRLVYTLKSLFETLLKNIGIANATAEVRFSLLSEFQKDYQLFLTSFRNNIEHNYGEKNVERLLDNLFCVRIENLSEILRLLRIYHGSLNSLFPMFGKTIYSPISLSISSSEAKFPFFEHYRILGEAEEEIYVNIMGHGALRASLKVLPAILNASDFQGNRRALYRLAEVAKISESLAKLKMYDGMDDDRASYRRLREELLPFGLSYQSILTLVKIAGG